MIVRNNNWLEWQFLILMSGMKIHSLDGIRILEESPFYLYMMHQKRKEKGKQQKSRITLKNASL